MLNQEKIKEKADFILNRLLLVFFFSILIVYASREIVDLDLWLHLKTGEFIVKNKIVPLHDIFSFTIGAKPWINHEWFFQTIAYLFYAFGRADGLIFMQNLIVIATFILLLLMGLKEKNHIFVFMILYLTLLTVAYRFTIRPDIFSLFFLTSYLFLIKDFIETKSRSIWLLPIFQIFWVNMHGFSFTGPLLILIFLTGEIIKRSVKLPYSWNETHRLNDKEMIQLILILVLMILASLANPHGLKGAAYPLSVLGQISGKGRVVFQYIQELAKPITFRNIFNLNFFLFYKAYILISLFSFRFNQKHLNVSNLILWLFFLFFSFLAIRNVAYFAICAAFVTFSNVALAFKNNKEFPFQLKSIKLKTVGSYLVLAFLFYYPTKGVMKYVESSNYNFDTYRLKSGLWGISQQRYPQKAVEFLLSHRFPKHMFNDFNSGSYLIGQTYPKRLVFIDGRTELYGPEFFTNYVAMGEGKRGVLEKTIARYNIKGFFLTNTANDLHLGLFRFLSQNPRWKVVYFDEYAIIFLKDIKENAGVINKFRIDLKQWSPPKPDFMKIGIVFRYPLPFLERARFLNLLGCYEAAAREAKIVLEIMPNNAEALKYLADDTFEKKDYENAFKYTRNYLIYTAGSLQMRTRLALIYHFLKSDEKALKVINTIIKKKPKFSEGYYVKALILEETDKKSAKDLLRKASKLSPKEPKYHILLGDLLAKENNLSGAKKEWTAAFEYDSGNSNLKKKLGLVSGSYRDNV